ncbi:MAG: circadian clock protein KaiA [Halothece sp. Uz-M2-17]|nr:circadian clock protein KaiA [Halothece sp. Uz-M2-17]
MCDDPYHLRIFDSSDAVIDYILDQTEQIDCLVLHQGQGIEEVVKSLRNEGKLLPTVILTTQADDQDLVYHPAQTYLETKALPKIPTVIEGAIADFLQLTPESKPQFEIEQINEFLTIKQHRLTEKLQERLGYKGVYYKRHPQDFFRNLTAEEKNNLISELTEEYRLILLDYFKDATEVNSKIDQFVTRSFFADLSVSQIMEIHMDLMDQFSQQLKLEGRSDEILLDYRLTLIDIIAHLCEMYRRSIPTKVPK